MRRGPAAVHSSHVLPAPDETASGYTHPPPQLTRHPDDAGGRRAPDRPAALGSCEGTNKGTAVTKRPDSCSESGLDETWYRIPDSRQGGAGSRCERAKHADTGRDRQCPAAVRGQIWGQVAATPELSVSEECGSRRIPTCRTVLLAGRPVGLSLGGRHEVVDHHRRVRIGPRPMYPTRRPRRRCSRAALRRCPGRHSSSLKNRTGVLCSTSDGLLRSGHHPQWPVAIDSRIVSISVTTSAGVAGIHEASITRRS